MPVALKLSHWALTTTDGAGFVYRIGLLVSLDAHIRQLYDNILQLYLEVWQLYINIWQLHTLALDRGSSKHSWSAFLQSALPWHTAFIRSDCFPLWYISELAVPHHA